MRILIVEDYGPLRLAIAQRLREEGYTVDNTADGKEGLWFARENDYAVALLDINLPSIDGLRLLEAIRRLGKETSVIMITARDAVTDRVAGLDAGADDYLVKPLSDMAISTALPCRISVYREGDETVLSTIRPTALLGLVGGDGAAAAAREVEATMAAIMEEAARE